MIIKVSSAHMKSLKSCNFKKWARLSRAASGIVVNLAEIIPLNKIERATYYGWDKTDYNGLAEYLLQFAWRCRTITGTPRLWATEQWSEAVALIEEWKDQQTPCPPQTISSLSQQPGSVPDQGAIDSST